MRIALGLIAALLAVTMNSGPARAADAGLLVRTGLAASQIAIDSADNVYSLEPLGPPTPNGEIIALVRTEAASARWSAAHPFRSWDAHMLFDCRGARVRVIRSASYPEQNRQGEPRIDDQSEDWFSPRPEEPAAKLFAAACDPAYHWPLRTAAKAAIPNAADAAVTTAAHVAIAAPLAQPTELPRSNDQVIKVAWTKPVQPTVAHLTSVADEVARPARRFGFARLVAAAEAGGTRVLDRVKWLNPARALAWRRERPNQARAAPEPLPGRQLAQTRPLSGADPPEPLL